MKIQGEHHFRAPRDQVWAAVLDPKVLTSSLPGLQRLDTIGNHEYEGAFEITIGSVHADFQGTLMLSDLHPPSSYRFSLNGMGAAGLVDGDGILVLEDSGGGTRIHYEFEAKVGGRIAGVGQRALDTSAKEVARKILSGISSRVPVSVSENTPVKIMTRQKATPAPAESPEPPSEPETESPSTPPSSVKSAEPDTSASEEEKTANSAIPESVDASLVTGVSLEPAKPSQYGSKVAKGFLDDLIPRDKRPWILGAALVLYTVGVVLLTRACS